ncbi:response regulator [Blautia sp. RD014234]|nr:response regulator [Blautia parvula]
MFYNISVDTDNAMTLRFILQPIVENAILHGLVKQTTTGTLELSAWEEEDSLMIRVEDDGIGMDIQKVEELNRSINVADDLTHTGLSIGIRNVNQRIKLACGDQYGITIKSTLHYGSQFDLRLPLIRKGEKQMKRNLLIADDEELIRKGLIARLNYLGFAFGEILEAETGTEALEAVRENSISIVITDIRMPDMDGLVFIREAKKLSPHLRFMVLSGYAEFEYAKTALTLGASAYLLKPLSNQDLKEGMDKLLTQVELDTRIRRDITSRKKLEEENTAYTLEKEVNALLHEPEDEKFGKGKYPAFYHKISSAPGNRLLLGIVNIEEKSCENNFCKDDTEPIRFAVKNVFDEIGSPSKVLLVNSIIHRRQMYAVFESSGSEESVLRREVEQFFLEMRAVLEKKMGIYLTMGTSSQTGRLFAGILGRRNPPFASGPSTVTAISIFMRTTPSSPGSPFPPQSCTFWNST